MSGEKALETARRLQLDLAKPAGKMSGGTRRKLQAVLALMRPEAVVMMDEPSAGMDSSSRKELGKVIREERLAGKSMVVATHLLDEAEELGGRLAVMEKGKI